MFLVGQLSAQKSLRRSYQVTNPEEVPPPPPPCIATLSLPNISQGMLFPAPPRSEFISHTPVMTWLWYFPNRYKFHKSALFILFSSESLEVRKGKTNRIFCIYMESRKMVFMNLFAGQQWRCRLRTDLWIQWGKERVGQTERVALKHIHYRIDNR